MVPRSVNGGKKVARGVQRRKLGGEKANANGQVCKSSMPMDKCANRHTQALGPAAGSRSKGVGTKWGLRHGYTSAGSGGRALVQCPIWCARRNR